MREAETSKEEKTCIPNPSKEVQKLRMMQGPGIARKIGNSWGGILSVISN